MLNKESIKVLQSVTSITNSAIISYPVTTIINADADVLGTIDFSVIDPDEFEEFGIMDLGSFLNAIDVLEEPTITLENKEIIAKDDTSQISFITSSPISLSDFTTDMINITSIIDAPSVVEVKVDKDLIAKIRKGASVFKTLKDLFIIKNDEGVFLKTGNKESFASRDNSYMIKLDPEKSTGKNFEIAIPINNFLSLPTMESALKIKYNERRDSYRVTMENAIFKFVLSIRA